MRKNNRHGSPEPCFCLAAIAVEPVRAAGDPHRTGKIISFCAGKLTVGEINDIKKPAYSVKSNIQKGIGKMKKSIAGLLVMIMLVACTVSAFAVKAEYANAKDFLDKLDEMDIVYNVVSKADDEDKDDHIRVGNKGDYCSYNIEYFFNEDNDQVNIRVWYLITYKTEDLPDLLSALNKLNNTYKFCRWYADDSDNTVTLGWDMILRENADAGDIVKEATIRLAQIIDDAYPNIMKSIWQ